jgi:hypothetical protein
VASENGASKESLQEKRLRLAREMRRDPFARYRDPKSLWRQTLRAALIGLLVGASFGLLTSLGSWAAHQADSLPPVPGLTYIVRALDIGAFPGMSIVTSAHREGVAPDYVFSPGEVTSPLPLLALCNILFWAVIWAILLAWPGPVFALWLTLARAAR